MAPVSKSEWEIKVTSKGQITLPKQARDIMMVREGDHLQVRLLADATSGLLEVVHVTPGDVQVAIGIEMRQYLTAVDAVQMALASSFGDDVVFVSSDDKLNRVAGEMGIKTLNPAT